ncbi:MULTISPECIES: cell envelope integrity protein TolA [unclassified Moraxella]|uniref:cell envelope integrity protein TolA n=1 Tax=unclassified Moraxella TaxID=2685852 RepID=UPI003AF50A65
MTSGQITSVYVPVETPDYKTWAIILSLIGHGVLLGGLWFYRGTPPPIPMETTLITPEQFSAIEGQIQANQQNNAMMAGEMAGGGMTSPTTKSSHQPSPQAKAMMNDIANKQQQYLKQQAKFAEQIDREVEAEQQQVVEQLDQQQAEEQETLQDYRHAEDNLDEIRAEIQATSEAYKKDIKPKQTDNNVGQNLDLATHGKGISTSTSQARTGGNGSPRQGGATGGDSAGYINKIMSIIDANWRPPTNSMGKSLIASFTVASDGSISNISIKSAGDEIFKASLVKAIQSSSPLPPPPNGTRTFTGNFKAD